MCYPESNTLHVSRDVILIKQNCGLGNNKKKLIHLVRIHFIILGTHKTQGEQVTDDTGYTQGIETHVRLTTLTTKFENCDSNSGPKNFKSISDIYDHTEEVNVEDESFLMGIDELQTSCERARMKGNHKARERERERWNRLKKYMENNIITCWKEDFSSDMDLQTKEECKWETSQAQGETCRQEYVQEYGVDFYEIFAPMIHFERIMFTVGTIS